MQLINVSPSVAPSVLVCRRFGTRLYFDRGPQVPPPHIPLPPTYPPCTCCTHAHFTPRCTACLPCLPPPATTPPPATCLPPPTIPLHTLPHLLHALLFCHAALLPAPALHTCTAFCACTAPATPTTHLVGFIYVTLLLVVIGLRFCAKRSFTHMLFYLLVAYISAFGPDTGPVKHTTTPPHTHTHVLYPVTLFYRHLAFPQL